MDDPEPAAWPRARVVDEASPPPRRPRPVIVVTFLTFWLVWLVALGLLRWHHPGHDHGDPTTDANILNGGDNFAREGLWSSWGVPAIDTFRADGHTPDRYITYPPGAYWFHHLVRWLGVRSLEGFRVVSIAISGLSVLLMFAMLSRVCRDAAPAAIACALYMLSKPFIEYADALHYISLSQFTLMLALYAWVRCDAAAEEGLAAAAILWLGVCIAAAIADAFLTFEHAMFIPAFAAIRTLWLRRWPRLLGVAVLLTVPAAVLMIRLVLNRAVLGSFEVVIAVMRGKFDQRIGSSAGGTGLAALWETWLPRLGWTAAAPRLPGDHPDAEFSLPVLGLWCLIPLALLAMLAIAHWHLRGLGPIRRLFGVGAALLLGGVTWFLFMTEHAIAHRFTVMLLLPGVAAITAALIATGLAQPELQPAAAPGRPRAIVRLIGPLIALAAFAAWCEPIRTSFALNTVMRADRTVRQAVHRREQALDAFAAAAGRLTGVNHLMMLAYDAPAARALARLFDNAPARGADPLPKTLRHDQAVLAPLWTPQAGAAAVRLADSLGLPAMLSTALPPYLLFTAEQTAAPSTNRLTTTSGLRIEQLAWRRAIDQRGWSLTLLATGPLDTLTSADARLVLRGQRPDNTWRPLATCSISAAPRDADRSLIVLPVADADVADVAAVELRLVSQARPRVSPWSIAPGGGDAGLPPGVSLTDGSIRWSQPPWRTRPAHVAPER